MSKTLHVASTVLLLALLAGCKSAEARSAPVAEPRAQPAGDALNVPLVNLENESARQAVRKALVKLEGVSRVDILEREGAAQIHMEKGASLSIARLEEGLARAAVSLDAERMLLGPKLALKRTGVRCPDC